jgi:hypothetical protein
MKCCENGPGILKYAKEFPYDKHSSLLRENVNYSKKVLQDFPLAVFELVGSAGWTFIKFFKIKIEGGGTLTTK